MSPCNNPPALPFSSESGLLADFPNQIEGLALLSHIHDGSIAAVFFDPQYRGILDKMRYGNEGVSRGQGRASLTQMTQTDIEAFLPEISRVLRPSGHLFLWVDKYHLCEGVLPWLLNTELSLVDMLVWSKQRIGMGYRTRRTAEYIVICQKAPKRARGVWLDHTIPDVWEERVSKTHPHRKPVALQARLLAAVTTQDDWVLDPAAGSYSVLEACKREHRHFIGGDVRMPQDTMHHAQP